MGVDKSTQMCAFAKIGKCYCAVEGGKTCSFAHPTNAELKQIACKCGRAKLSPMFFKNGPLCLYNHKLLGTPKTLQFASTAASSSGA